MTLRILGSLRVGTFFPSMKMGRSLLTSAEKVVKMSDDFGTDI